MSQAEPEEEVRSSESFPLWKSWLLALGTIALIWDRLDAGMDPFFKLEKMSGLPAYAQVCALSVCLFDVFILCVSRWAGVQITRAWRGMVFFLLACLLGKPHWWSTHMNMAGIYLALFVAFIVVVAVTTYLDKIDLAKQRQNRNA